MSLNGIEFIIALVAFPKEQNLNKKDKINILSIIGLITSFFSIIIGSILCFVALSQIKDSKERGKGLAIAGITINIVKTFDGSRPCDI